MRELVFPEDCIRCDAGGVGVVLKGDGNGFTPSREGATNFGEAGKD